jgi:carboxylesterase type B
MAIYEWFANELKCSARDVLCLRNKTVDEIVNAQFLAEKQISSFRLLEFFEPWLPWIDGSLIKGQLLEFEKWMPNNQKLKPFMLGTLTEEAWIFINLVWPKGMTTVDYVTLMLAGFKNDGLKVIEKYKPDISQKYQTNLTSTVATKWIFACSSRRFIEKIILSNQTSSNNYYLYAFDYPLDFPGWENFTFCNGHTCHGADLPYTFDEPDDRFTSNGHQLAMSHINYWANFAKYGDPNSNNDYLKWPQYSVKDKESIRFRSPNLIETNYLKDDCDFLDSIGYYH